METNKIHNVNCIDGIKQLDENSVDLIVTSPPYNVGIDYDSWNDQLEWDDYKNFMNSWLSECFRVLKKDGRMALNIPYEINIMDRGGRILLMSEYWEVMKKVGFKFAGLVDLKEIQSQRVKMTAWGSWLSPSAPYIYNPKECVILAYKEMWKKDGRGTSYFKDDATHKREFQNLVSGEWDYRAETRGLTKANFSESLPLNCIKLLSFEEELVLDPFMGSGTTAWACKQLNRRFIGFEISEQYTRIAKSRASQTVLSSFLTGGV